MTSPWSYRCRIFRGFVIAVTQGKREANKMDESIAVKCASCGVVYPIGFRPIKFVQFDGMICLACMKGVEYGATVAASRQTKEEAPEEEAEREGN